MRAHIEPESLIFLPDTGHNLHHDAPVPLAEVIEGFLLDVERPRDGDH